MDLEMRHLRLIAAVADEGSVTRAGNRLHLTQSAISHQLRDAEDRLGTQLFLRLNRKMIPTPAGQRLLQTARVVIDEMERVERDVRRSAQPGGGLIRLATSCYTCYHWLPERLKRFQARFPGVDAEIVVEATHHALEFLLDGRLDLAILEEKPRHRSVNVRPLFEDELVVIAAPNHPIARQLFVRPEDFCTEVMFHQLSREESTLISRELIPAGYVPKRVSKVELTEALVEMVRCGLGIAVQARWAVLPELEAGRLVAKPLSKKGLHRRWYAATLKNGAAPPHIREFVKLLAEDPLGARPPVAACA